MDRYLSHRATTLKQRSAFTLIELLVVVAIIALLIAILVPSLAEARRQTRRTVCLSRMHQVAISLASYQADYEGAYPTAVSPYHWPMGWCTAYTGHSPHTDTYIPAGPSVLFAEKYIETPEFFYCPAAKPLGEGWFHYDRLSMTWDPANWQPNGVWFPMVGYCYWAGWRTDDKWTHLDPDFQFERVAHPRHPKPDQVVWTDITTWAGDTWEQGWGAGWEASNHKRDRAEHPIGGNELLVDGSANWHAFNEEKMKRRVRIGGLDLYFVGPVRPGDENLPP